MSLMALIQLLLAVCVLIVLIRAVIGGPPSWATFRPLLPWLIVVAVVWFLIKNLDLFSFLNSIRL